MKRLAAVVITVTLLLVVYSNAQSLAPSRQNTSPVQLFADGSEVPGAWSRLIRTVDTIVMEIATSGLEPNAVYTVWWVIFNNPGGCRADPMGDPGTPVCNEDDILDAEGNMAPNPLARISVLWATGNMAQADGRGFFSAALQEGNPPGEVLFGSGLESARRAEVHLVLRSHGQPDLARLYEQLNTFEGECAVCEEPQFVIHLPPQ